MLKAMREAKGNTSWLNPDEAYEAAVLRFVDDILDPRRAVPAGVPAVSGARRRARHLQQPRPAAHQDHGARRSRLLSGHRAVGSVARRSGQPPAGRLRPAARGPRRGHAGRAARRGSSSSGRDGRVKMFVMMRALGSARRSRERLRARRLRAAAVDGRTPRATLFAFARRRRQRWRSPACRGWSRHARRPDRRRRSAPERLGRHAHHPAAGLGRPPAFRDAITGARIERRRRRRRGELDASGGVRHSFQSPCSFR